jgi:hypothetical protein
MEAYIEGMCAISPQRTFSGENIFGDIIPYENSHCLKCIEPEYNKYLDPMVSRRMSRIVKMSIVTALRCLNEAGIGVPDSIITGTGLGCIEDTEKFLRSLHVTKEGLLNPTPFINSTHNAISSGIAIFIKCYGYNNTFSHRGSSFESAMLDGLMLLNEGSVSNVLVGGADETTRESVNITGRLGFWKRETVCNLKLLDYDSKGTLPGEGTAFFLLSRKRSDRSLAKIVSTGTFNNPESYSATEKRVSAFLAANPSPDLIMLGLNGDNRTDKVYNELKNGLFSDKPCTYFKHLCGEYDTASSFALYLAISLLKAGKVNSTIRLDNKPVEKLESILIYNHLRNCQHSMIMLSSC